MTAGSYYLSPRVLPSSQQSLVAYVLGVIVSGGLWISSL